MAPGEQMGGQTHGVGWGSRNVSSELSLMFTVHHDRTFHSSLPLQYHPGTTKGDQTDYGEYNVLVLEHLATKAADSNKVQSFDISEFIPLWQKRLTNGWKQWICTQTKQTYQQIQQGVPINNLGGNSNAMALRCSSMFAYYTNEDDIVDAAKKTMFTHKERTAHLGNEFFARVVYRIIHKQITPTQAIKEVASESDLWIQKKVKQALDKVEEATDPNNELSKEEFVDDLALTSMARLWEEVKKNQLRSVKPLRPKAHCQEVSISLSSMRMMVYLEHQKLMPWLEVIMHHVRLQLVWY